MRRTLAWQLAARYLLVLAALLGGSAAFQYVALQHFLLVAATDRLRTAARQPVHDYAAGLAEGTAPDAAAQTLVDSVSDRRTMAWVIGPDGSVWAEAGAAQALPPTLPSAQQPLAAGQTPSGTHPLPPSQPLSGPVSTSQPQPPRQSQPPKPPSSPGRPPGGPGQARPYVVGGQLVFPMPLPPVQGGGAPTLILATNLRDVLAVLGSEIRLLVLGGAAALVLGGASAVLAVRRALRPLTAISAAAERIAGGDLQVRAGRPGVPEEVAHLARAFDAMVDRLTAVLAEERATHQQMRRLLDDASHELRTPLTALSGTLEVLQGDAGDDPAVLREGLRIAYRQSRRMGSLVAGLLALARAERPEGLPLHPTDLGEVLLSIRPAAERAAADHRLQWTVPVGDLPVLGNPDALGGAVLNVLDNAVRYSPIGTEISVQARRAGDLAEVTVTDHGPGIPPECLPLVFDRFYRCPPAPGAPSQTGTGLGLAIVRSVMEQHRGTASIESAPGQGTTVRLALPLSTRQPD